MTDVPSPTALTAEGVAAFHAGRRQWPTIAVTEVEFANFVSAADPEGLISNAGDLYLACACGVGHSAAVQILFARHLSLVTPYLMKRGFPRDVAEEVSQSLGERLFTGPRPRILSYGGSGDLHAWVRLVAYREALDQVRATRAEDVKRIALADELAATISGQDPEMMLLRTDCAAVVRTALQEAIAGLDARQKTILRLYYVSGLSIDRIGVVFHIHRATAARQVAQIREQLIGSVSSYLRDLPGFSASDQRSMNALARSQISLELEALLQKTS